MNIQGYTRQYAQAWKISTENSAKLVIPALAAAVFISAAIRYYFPDPTTPTPPPLGHNGGRLSASSSSLPRAQQVAQARKTNIIRIIGAVCGFFAFSYVQRHSPLKPLSVWQMSAMGITTVVIGTIVNSALSAKSSETARRRAWTIVAIPFIAFSASAIGRLGGLISNCTQRLFNR